MIVSTDRYLGRMYDRYHYNCFHFARDVWLDLTGVDIAPNVAEEKLDSKFLKPSYFKGRTRLNELTDPCIVILSRTKCESHMGIFLRGKLLHMHEHGVVHQPLELVQIGFDTLRYYA